MATGNRVLVLGGGYAGVTAALRLSRLAGRGASITLVNPTDRLVERIRLHQVLAGGPAREVDLGPMLRRRRVALRIGTARGIDLAGRTVDVDGEPLAWDRLVLALGSRVDGTGVPGAREHALTLDGGGAARGAAALRRLAVGGGGRVVVVGGGLTGIESATELAEAYPSLRVTLATAGRLAPDFSEAARTHLLSVFGRLGIDLVEDVRIAAVEAAALATDRGPIPFDACVWAAGFTFPELPRAAGLAVNGRGQVLVDATLRSVSHPDVWAVGDVAVPAAGPAPPLGCKTAQPSGASAAENLARDLRGERGEPFGFATPFYCVSLGRADGLIQLTAPDGSPTGSILTGRRAAWFKEMIAKTTIVALRAESVSPVAVVRWPRLPAAESGPLAHAGA